MELDGDIIKKLREPTAHQGFHLRGLESEKPFQAYIPRNCYTSIIIRFLHFP